MKKRILMLFTGLIFVGCSSSNENFNTSNSSEFLVQNAWEYNRTEIESITSHGSLSISEARNIIENRYNNGNRNTILSFDSDGTGIGIVTFYLTQGQSQTNRTNFGWIITPDNKLRIFISNNNAQEPRLFNFTVNRELLTLTDDREYLYSGTTLIKYKAKEYYRKQ